MKKLPTSSYIKITRTIKEYDTQPNKDHDDLVDFAKKRGLSDDEIEEMFSIISYRPVDHSLKVSPRDMGAMCEMEYEGRLN